MRIEVTDYKFISQVVTAALEEEFDAIKLEELWYEDDIRAQKKLKKALKVVLDWYGVKV